MNTLDYFSIVLFSLIHGPKMEKEVEVGISYR